MGVRSPQPPYFVHQSFYDVHVRAAVVLAFVVVFAGLISGAAAQTSPPAPTNLEVVGVTPTSVTLAWGPSLPGPFSIVSSSGNSVTVGWGASKDTRSPVSYHVSKDGGTSVVVNTNQYRFAGVQKNPSFRICVTAVNGAGQLSPTSCGTISHN